MKCLQKLCLALLMVSALVAPAYASPASDKFELQLAKAIQALDQHRMDDALAELDALLQVNPKFKLAQLIKGDLLMAYAGGIQSFGSADNASPDDIEDLRAEAVVRLQRVFDQTHTRAVPRYLWRLAPSQKYVLVADTDRSTMYVYENVRGQPRYVTDFYMTIGKLGPKKTVEGDQRTPIGVYYITAFKPNEELEDLYGNGAFPVNYPNEWDKRNDRTGYGIWIHGTPSNTYSRPPRASNGCMVVSNDDFDRLASYVEVGVTPVIVTSQMSWIDEYDLTDRDQLLRSIEQWRRDWESLNPRQYLSHYSYNFEAGKVNYRNWVSHKQDVNQGKEWVRVGISNLSIFTYPGYSNMAVVQFDQDYRSNNLNDKVYKRQYWMKKDNRWQIIYEGDA